MNISIVLIFIIMYCLCMFNPAIEMCKKKTGADLRRLGSMDASTNNAIKVLGRLLGALVIAGNILKIVISFYIAKLIAGWINIDVATTAFKSAVILGCMIGHCFPAIYKFNGGKGTLEFITLMALLSPKYVLVCVASGLVILAITRVVAKGTLAGCVLYLILSVIIGCDYLPALAISLAIILYRHRENIQRIMNKQEETI